MSDDFKLIQLSPRIFKLKRGVSFLHGISVGTLGSSIGFYLAFDQWRPMVVSAGLVCVIEIIANLIRATDV